MQQNKNPEEFDHPEDQGFYIFSDCGRVLAGPYKWFDDARRASWEYEDSYVDWM